MSGAGGAQGRKAAAVNREAQGRKAAAVNREAQGRKAAAVNNVSPTGRNHK